MTEDVAAHMRHPTVDAARSALGAHLADHAECRDIIHQRDLCPEGRRLYDAVVMAAQEAYRAVHPEAFAPEPHDG